MCDAFHVVSTLPMRRPLPLVEPLAAALRAVPPPFEPDQLVKLYDALARMRYDAPTLLVRVDLALTLTLTLALTLALTLTLNLARYDAPTLLIRVRVRVRP